MVNGVIKQHKGIIYHWKQTFMSEEVKQYQRDHYKEEPGLGYFIEGYTTDPPRLGSYFRTSWVVAHDHDDEIETRNSRYTLLKPGYV